MKVGDVFEGPRHGRRDRVLRFIEDDRGNDVMLWDETFKQPERAVSARMEEHRRGGEGARMSVDDQLAEDLADWDRRFRRWRLEEGPITPEDEIEPFSPGLSDMSMADIKRRARG